MPVPLDSTCSRYQPSTMNTGHSAARMIQAPYMPLLGSDRSDQVMPGTLAKSARMEYSLISYRPLLWLVGVVGVVGWLREWCRALVV